MSRSSDRNPQLDHISDLNVQKRDPLANQTHLAQQIALPCTPNVFKTLLRGTVWTEALNKSWRDSSKRREY